MLLPLISIEFSCKKKEFAPLGNKFFLLRADPFSYGVRYTRKQLGSQIYLPYKNGTNIYQEYTYIVHLYAESYGLLQMSKNFVLLPIWENIQHLKDVHSTICSAPILSASHQIWEKKAMPIIYHHIFS